MFGIAVAETGDEFSIMYTFINIFLNNVCSKFNNVSNFVFRCSKTKLGI